MCLDIETNNSVVDSYMKYKRAIKTGLADTAKTFKFEFIDKLFLKLKVNCSSCGTINSCTAGCYKVIQKCSPTIEEYNEIKNCQLGSCIKISEIK